MDEMQVLPVMGSWHAACERKLAQMCLYCRERVEYAKSRMYRRQMSRVMLRYCSARGVFPDFKKKERTVNKNASIQYLVQLKLGLESCHKK